MPQPVVIPTNNKPFLSQVIREFHPSRLLPSLVAGLVAGIITVIIAISLAALIFSGDLSGFVSRGIGLMLFGAVVIGIVISVTSSYPGVVAAPQDVPAVILALVAASIAGSMPVTATSDETFLTIVATIAITSLITGLLFWALGYFKLGSLVRFLPYPVVGGFLAGTGWLLFKGAIEVMADVPVSFSQALFLFQSGLWMRWLPGFIFAVLLLVILNKYNHLFIIPGMILGAVGLFYAVMWFTGTPFAQVSANGWLLGPFPEESLWQPLTFADLAHVNWPIVLGQLSNIAAIFFISIIALLLNATGLELIVKQDIDLNRELKATGFGNLATGLGGSVVGYHALSLSALGYKLGTNSRLLGLFSAGFCGIMLIFGASTLSLFPKVVIGGLLMFLGLSLLVEWVYQAWFKFSRVDYLIIITILIVIAVAGFLPGVTLGIILAVVLFVVNYSRINVVKHALSGADYQSWVTRRREHRQILQKKGDEIYILELQGFIFFGTANNLLEQVRRRVEASHLPRLRFVILDFRQVTGLDSTAGLSFEKINQLAQTRQIVLVFTSPSGEGTLPAQRSSVARLFAQLTDVDPDETEKTVRSFPDLDHGLEWCENQILLAAGVNPDDDKESLRFQFSALLPNATNLDNLLNYFERLEVGSGYYLMKQGDPPEDLYFIETGQVTAQLEFPDRSPVRLEKMRGGRVVGEIGFYLNRPRTAAVVTNQPSTIYRLSMQTVKQMEQHDPAAASLFHQGINRLVSERVAHLINTVNALQR